MKSRKHILRGILSLALVLSLVLPPVQAFADEPDRATVTDAQPGGATATDAKPALTEIEDPYAALSFAAAREQGLLKETGLEQAEFSVQERVYKDASPKTQQELLIIDTAEHFNAAKLEVLGTYDFEKYPVGRVSVNGVREDGVSVNVKLYLDDETEPFAVLPLPVLEQDIESEEENKKVDTDGTVTANIYDLHITGKHLVSAAFEVSGTQADEKTTVSLRDITFQAATIPTVSFNIDETRGTIKAMNESRDHSVRCYGTADVFVPDDYVCEYTGTGAESLQGLELDYIRGRGNSTWDSLKKPYKFKLKKGQDLFGMGKNKHWVLVANRFDNSHLRNRMTYWLSEELGMEFSPQCVPVEVVMNGRYLGLYLLCEQVRVDSDRVDIDELDPAAAYTEEELTGGYLLSMTPYGNEAEADIFKTTRDVSFLNQTPTFEETVNENMRSYIHDYIQKTEDAIFGEDFKDENGVRYTDYMDLDSAVDYWLVQEFSKNGDAYNTSSTYLYKKRNGKLFWGPLWDFDFVAWGDLQYDEMQTEDFVKTRTTWFDRMKEDPVFTEALYKRLPDLLKAIDKITEPGGVLDTYKAEILMAQRYDENRWGFYDPSLCDFDKEVEQLRSWILERRTWVDENKEHLNKLVIKVTYMLDDQVLHEEKMLYGDSFVMPSIDDPKKDGYIFTGWYFEDGRKFKEGAKNTGDTVICAHFIDKASATKATGLFFSQKTYYLKPGEEMYGYYYYISPVDVQDRSVIWKSSDESVATVNENGDVQMLKKGKAVITGTLASGNSASFTVIADPDTYDASVPAKAVFEQKEMEIEVGEYAQLAYSFDPAWGYTSYGFTSEDEGIVSVDNTTGVVYGASVGTTTVSMMDYAVPIGGSGPDIEPTLYPCTIHVVEKKTVKKKIGDCTFTAPVQRVYTGKRLTPAVTIKDGSKTLKKGTDYTLTYSYNLNVGRASIKITGKGDYEGSVTKTFKIIPKGTDLKTVTAAKGAFTATWKKQPETMSSSYITGYQIQYSTDKNFAKDKTVRSVLKYSRVGTAVKGLKTGKTYYVRIRTYKKVNGVNFFSVWSDKKAVKIK